MNMTCDSVQHPIMVVGATGYLGSTIYSYAKNLGKASGTSTSGRNGLHRLSLAEPEQFDYGIIDPRCTVLLSAAMSSPDLCAMNYSDAWAINVLGTVRFASQALDRGARVIFFSTDAVYGDQPMPFDESSPANPVGAYAVMKLEVERQLASHINFKSVRLSYVFSKEDKFTQYLIKCARDGDEAALYHSFGRSVIHRNDVVEGVFALTHRWNEFPDTIINFGGPDFLSRMDVARSLKKIAFERLSFKQVSPPLNFFTNRPRNVNMKSPILEKLLNRSARTLNEAILYEFS